MSKYAFGKTVNMSYEKAIEAVTQALAKEGFGVLTEIDVQATLKKKLNLERPPYKILGACNPQFAAKALEAEPQIGALLPCNVVVRRGKDAGSTTVEAIDPQTMVQLSGTAAVQEVADDAGTRLRAALAALGGEPGGGRPQ
jgi:uncharacterized protein (DUF302 family)